MRFEEAGDVLRIVHLSPETPRDDLDAILSDKSKRPQLNQDAHLRSELTLPVAETLHVRLHGEDHR